MQRRILVLTALAASAMTVVLAAPASAGGSAVETTIKEPGGSFELQLADMLAAGEKRTYKVKAQNVVAEAIDAKILELDGVPSDVKTKYFRKNKNITEDVTGLGFQFHLQVDQAKKFEVRVKALEDPGAFCVSVQGQEVGMGSAGVAQVAFNGPPCSV